MSNPEYVKVDGKLYKINTDFRVALECDSILRDTTISDFERIIAFLFKLFGKDGVTCENEQELINKAMKYLSLGQNEKGLKIDSDDKFEMDFQKCKGLIQSSFKFDYGYDPYSLEYLHWYDFYNDLQNLSTSEFGTCCKLNQVITILKQNPSEIKDNKQREQLIKLQKYYKEQYCREEEKQITEEQERSAKELYKALGMI